MVVIFFAILTRAATGSTKRIVKKTFTGEEAYEQNCHTCAMCGIPQLSGITGMRRVK